MKLLNKKGFALVETLIVTTFVMTIFIFVYQNLVPLIGEYEKIPPTEKCLTNIPFNNDVRTNDKNKTLVVA